MNEQNKKQIIAVGVLAVLLIGVLVYQFVLAGDPPPAPSTKSAETDDAADTSAKGKKPAEKPEVAANVLEATEIDIDELTQSVEVQPIDYSAVRIARNPMAPLVGSFLGETSVDTPTTGAPPPVQAPRREVTGIIWDSVQPVAIIDNMVVHRGYVFADGVVVHDIEPTRVLLKIGESIRPLEMKEF